MLNLDQLRVDTKAESEGAWFTLTCGMRVKLARASEHAVSAAVRDELGDEGLLALRKGKLSAEQLKRVQNIAIGRASVRDWEPVDCYGGEFLFSQDNLLRLLRDDGLHDIRDEIGRLADSSMSFREAFLRDAEKN